MCKHDNAYEDGYFNCMYCEDCNKYVEYEDYEKIINFNLKEVK